jgi:hypothetical protein
MRCHVARRTIAVQDRQPVRGEEAPLRAVSTFKKTSAYFREFEMRWFLQAHLRVFARFPLLMQQLQRSLPAEKYATGKRVTRTTSRDRVPYAFSGTPDATARHPLA